MVVVEHNFVSLISTENDAVGVFGVLVFGLMTLLFGWFVYRWTLFNYRSFPPGPIGFPIVGYMGVLLRAPHVELFELSKKYGKIFSLYFGTHYVVATTDYDIAKELVSHPATLARPEDVFEFIPGGGGFAGASGLEWQEQRRFCVGAIRNMRVGGGVWETMIKDHADEFIEEISSWSGKPTDPGEPMDLSAASINLSLLIGRRLSKKTNPETLILIGKVSHILSEHFDTSSLSIIMPLLTKYLVRFRIGEYHKHAHIMEEFDSFVRQEVKKHMNSKEAGYEEDFIGSYLKVMEKKNATKSHHYFSVDNLVGHLIVLFFASSDAIGSSLNWLLLLMAAFPEMQKKVQQEVDEVIGSNRQAAWVEREHFPYTMAVILEMERFVAVNHLFPPRISTESFECAGYTIPKGSRIVVNSWAVMHDPKYWDNPMEFLPERFIRNDGKDTSKTPGVSAFSFGKRNCPGEAVALMTIFLFFTVVMQKFTIKPAPGCTPDLSEGRVAANVSPVKQQLCFVERD